MTDSEAHNTALDLLDKNRPDKAVELVRPFINENPSCLYLFACALGYAGKYSDSESAFHRLAESPWLEDLTEEENPFKLLAVLALAQGDLPRALKYFEQAKQALPVDRRFTHWLLYEWCGLCHHLDSNFTAAAENYAIASAIVDLSGFNYGFRPSIKLMQMAISKTPITEANLRIEPFYIDYADGFLEGLQ